MTTPLPKEPQDVAVVRDVARVLPGVARAGTASVKRSPGRP